MITCNKYSLTLNDLLIRIRSYVFELDSLTFAEKIELNNQIRAWLEWSYCDLFDVEDVSGEETLKEIDLIGINDRMEKCFREVFEDINDRKEDSERLARDAILYAFGRESLQKTMVKYLNF